jgi:hypothetical protein
MRTVLALTLTLAVLIPACGGDDTKRSAYAEQVEGLVTTMNDRLDEIDAEVHGSTDVELIHWYAAERVAARHAFLEGLTALIPPEELAPLHASALEIMERLAAAESALADRVLGTDTIADIDTAWETPEGVAARAADADAIALCKAAEQELDMTEERANLEGVPWVPAEMRDVVKVAFGCEASER